MEDGLCEICVREYQSGVVVPRVLECGHSVCTSCIEELMNSSRVCPKCRGSFTQSSADQYPINYSLIGIIDSLNDSNTIETRLRKRLLVQQKKFVAIETKLAENKLQLDSNIEIVKDGLKQIQEFLDVEEDELNINDTNKVLVELIQSIKTVTNDGYYKLRNSATLSPADYNSSEAFIREIYKQIVEGGEIFAVTKIENEVKYAEVSVRSDKLLVHAFGPPKEKTSFRLIWFQDLKKCLSDNCRAFLEIICNENGRRQTMTLKPSNSSLVPQFLRYCTGESGPVYKGTSFYQGTSNISYAASVMKIDNFILQGRDSKGNYEYVSGLGLATTYNTNQVVCSGFEDGSFQIFKLSSNVNLSNVIAVIEEPLDIDAKITYGAVRKIVDSGILISVD